jgi:1-acyl-sn-glycerol-3-phosphate acyltransferase
MIAIIKSSLMILYTFFLSGVVFFGLLFDPTRRIYTWFAKYLWARPLLGLGGLTVVSQKSPDIDWTRTYVVCSNHSSQMDIPALFSILEMPARFLAKRSLFYIPVFGWSMWLARFIPVDRASGKKARDSMDKIALQIKKGPSVIVFPEGTRSPDGNMLPFKSGAFIMAVKAQVPVLPVAIRGAFEVLPKDTLKIKSGTIEVIVGNPIPTAGMQDKDRQVLRKSVQSVIEKMAQTGQPV